MNAVLNLLALVLPFAGGLALGTFGAPWGLVVAALSIFIASAFQGAARLYADPWDDFQGIEGDD